VAVLAGAFVGLLVFGLIVGYGTFRFMFTPETTTVVPSPLQPGRVVPAGPLLQVNAQEDLRAYQEQQQRALASYGWVDQGAGVVRIPIDRAMDLVLQRGLPTRSEAAGSAAAGTRGEGGNATHAARAATQAAPAAQ